MAEMKGIGISHSICGLVWKSKKDSVYEFILDNYINKYYIRNSVMKLCFEYRRKMYGKTN